jgi:transcriptional regulator with XRE-family HTH domain
MEDITTLAQVRAFFGFSQSQMADYLGVDQGQIAHHEKGKRSLSKQAHKYLEILLECISELNSDSLPEPDFSGKQDVAYWSSRANFARNSADKLRGQLEILLASRQQIRRVLAFTDSFAGDPNRLAERSLWWKHRKELTVDQIPAVSDDLLRTLKMKIALLTEEARMADLFANE